MVSGRTPASTKATPMETRCRFMMRSSESPTSAGPHESVVRGDLIAAQPDRQIIARRWNGRPSGPRSLRSTPRLALATQGPLVARHRFPGQTLGPALPAPRTATVLGLLSSVPFTASPDPAAARLPTRAVSLAAAGRWIRSCRPRSLIANRRPAPKLRAGEFGLGWASSTPSARRFRRWPRTARK